MTTAPDPHWVTRFRTPHLLTVRPVVGDPDAALVVENGVATATARVWDASTGELSAPLPWDVNGEIMLTRDRRLLIQLDDDGGSEVGHLVARALDGSGSTDLTPELDAYVVRGMDLSADGRWLTATLVDEDGWHLERVDLARLGEHERIATLPNEAWFGAISADGALLCWDTTEQNPGIRRTAVTVYDAGTREVVAICDDLPRGPVRALRFSAVPGDPRLLLSTERSGFARPAIWNPLDGERIDLDLPELGGEVLPLDWDAEQDLVLAVHIDGGIQRLLAITASTGEVRVAREGTGSYVDPDVASAVHHYQTSYLGSGGHVRSVEQSWATPPAVVDVAPDGTATTVLAGADVPAGIPFASERITSADGTPVQLWWARPRGEVRGTVLEVHGGPNLVTTDHYSPSAQAWLEEGYAYASLNYRGSVTFGRDFREGFWGAGGDREIEDVSAAVHWLRTRGLADAASTFITGPSYGGHLTLLSCGRLPELFAGGFAIVAMADWRAALDDMNPAVRTVWLNFLRNDDRDLDELIDHFSPISWAGDVTASIWLQQGSRDTRTPPAQAQSYADRRRAAGGDVLIEWFDAGHEPVGLQLEELTQRRMLELAERTRAGRPWSD